MTAVEQVQFQLSKLSRQELARFRTWYFNFDSEEWDRQVEQDADTGRLDAFGQRALQDHASGASRPV
ncbi:hypothetical protein [Dokdonella sp.]|uniref:hypothetical protein n=1 Tax=Dokdonella sp. TaxID=2291710 RepID=UPI003C67227C